MKIVHINQYKQRRMKPMYEKLIEHLRNNPATSYSIQDAETLAYEVLTCGGFDECNGPTPITKITEGFGFEVYEEPDIPEDISGNVYVGGNTAEIYGKDKIIIVGENEKYFHQRFIIAHELEHYLTDYLGNPAYMDKPYKLFSMAYPKQDHESQKETRADRFAAELLTPKKSFLERYAYAMNKSNNSMLYTVSYLSNYFEVKKSSVEKRIKEVFSYYKLQRGNTTWMKQRV